jgi:RNA polymerase sigma-70 factor (ECF subfamily)
MSPKEINNQLVATLFHTRGADLLRFVRMRAGNEADAREIAQESYARLLRLARIELVRNPEAYLFRIAANLLSEYRLGRRQQADLALLAEPAVEQNPGFEAAVSQERAASLDAVLDKIPVNRRAALVLHLRDELTCAQIAQQMGVSVSMVKKHLAAALAHCRKKLRDHKP